MSTNELWKFVTIGKAFIEGLFCELISPLCIISTCLDVMFLKVVLIYCGMNIYNSLSLLRFTDMSQRYSQADNIKWIYFLSRLKNMPKGFNACTQVTIRFLQRNTKSYSCTQAAIRFFTAKYKIL